LGMGLTSREARFIGILSPHIEGIKPARARAGPAHGRAGHASIRRCHMLHSYPRTRHPGTERPRQKMSPEKLRL
jgi:hypothetical protein